MSVIAENLVIWGSLKLPEKSSCWCSFSILGYWILNPVITKHEHTGDSLKKNMPLHFCKTLKTHNSLTTKQYYVMTSTYFFCSA